MGFRILLQTCKRIVLHPVREYRRLRFRLLHANRGPHDIVCRIKDFSLKLCSDSVLAKPLFVGTGFEEGETKLLRRLAKPGMQVIDVGANIGFYTVLLGKLVGKTGHVWSFEPFPPAVNYLKQNIELNKLNNITVIEKAVAEKEDALDFHVFAEGCDVYNSLGASYRPVEQLRSVGRIVVPVISLDGLFNKGELLKADILKVDVEGAEERVLVGARDLIKNSPNLVVVAEMGTDSARQCGCSIQRAIEYMRDMGFVMHRIGPRGTISPAEGLPPEGGYVCFLRM